MGNKHNKQMKQKDMRIENVIFSKIVKLNSINPNAIEQFSKQKWWLYNRFQNQKWNQLFQMMKQVDVLELQLSQIQQKNIIKSISHIYFSKLTRISLAQNKIQSIQPLQFMNFYLVQRLDLENNNISCIKALSKTYFPNLINLNINKNPVLVSNQLSKSYLNDYNQNLEFGEYKADSFKIRPILRDFSVLSKLCIKVCDRISICSQNMIYQFKVTKMIVKAYDIRYINQNIEDDRQLRIYYKIKMKEATESN